MVYCKKFCYEFLDHFGDVFLKGRNGIRYGILIVKLVGRKHPVMEEVLVGVLRRKFGLLWPEFYRFDCNKEGYEDYVVRLGFGAGGGAGGGGVKEENFGSWEKIAEGGMRKFDCVALEVFFVEMDYYSSVLFGLMTMSMYTELLSKFPTTPPRELGGPDGSNCGKVKERNIKFN